MRNNHQSVYFRVGDKPSIRDAGEFLLCALSKIFIALHPRHHLSKSLYSLLFYSGCKQFTWCLLDPGIQSVAFNYFVSDSVDTQQASFLAVVF